jgi:tRNA(Ile)-lysidine synthetase-like protein
LKIRQKNSQIALQGLEKKLSVKPDQDALEHFTKMMMAAGLPCHRLSAPSSSSDPQLASTVLPPAILLAVSGGPDSMGLAALLLAWQSRQSHPRHDLFGVVVDHGLRQGSDEEADWVADTLTQHGLPTYVVRVTAAKPAAGLADWARQQRYDLLRQEALSRQAIILTAHHQDDQLETIEMRLSRGSGLRGLAGMALQTCYLGVGLIRPCLDFSKKALAEIAAQAGLPFIHDPTNSDERFERPRIRKNRPWRSDAGIKDRQLLRLSTLSSRLITQLDHLLMTAAPPWVEVMIEGFVKMPRQALWHRGFPHMVRKTLRHMMAKPYPPSDEAMSELATRLRLGKDATLGGCEWRLDARWPDDIIICRETGDMAGVAEFEQGKGVFDGRWLINYPTSVRVEPLGARRFAALKRAYPDDLSLSQAMPRAFWSMPVLIGIKNKNLQDHGRLLLDDDALVPHVLNRDNLANMEAHPNMACQRLPHGSLASFIGGWNGS